MAEPDSRVAPWEDYVLRLIAIYKLAKALIAFALGFELLRFMHHNVADFVRDYIIEPYRFDPESRFFKWLLEEAAQLTSHKLAFLGFGAFFYGLIFAAEGFGLYFRKHWAEYMVIISTASLMPIEFWEIYLKLAWWKFGVVAGNVLIIVYLVHRLQLDAHFKAQSRAAEAVRELPAPERSAKPVASEVP